MNFLNNMNLNSMAQDVITIKREKDELEYLNGYLLELADTHSLKVPYNRALYKACKERFKQEKLHPMTERELWTKIQKEFKQD